MSLACDAGDAQEGVDLGRIIKEMQIERLTCTELGEASNWAVLTPGTDCECKPAPPSQHLEGRCKAGGPAAGCALQNDPAARCMLQLAMLVDALQRPFSV